MSESFEHPSRIGPYHIIQVIGEGGMGIVYEAEQQEPVRRRVALKMMKVGMDTKEVVARFDAERQALAVMEHPGIAKVFDAGATERGRPYFVMELVRGTKLTDYCDRQRLTTRQRVELFATVCEAVQHAHQKGVIHRDLKPSNVLVAEVDGTPASKVIDFGVARAVEYEEGDGTRLTRAGHAPGTPAYMSPEQVLGDSGAVDTRTDIYSLGVILYELLGGALPREHRIYQGAALMGAVVGDPPPPSTRFNSLTETQQTVARLRQSDPVSLRRHLKGDLDWIVMKAMAAERDRRYETADGLAMDLRRYLDDDPILARPPSTRYRLGKFGRRHKLGVAFTATVAALLVGVTINQTIQAERIRQARDLADTRRGQAEGLIDYMLTDLRAKLTPIGRLEILTDVGDQAMAYFAAIPEEELSDEELLSRSLALYQIGDVRLDQGQADEAITAYQESLRLATELSSREPADTARLRQLNLSRYGVGYAAFMTDDLDAAEAAFRSNLQVHQQLVELDESNPDRALAVASSQSNIGSVLAARGDLEGAVEAFSSAMLGYADAVDRRPDDLDALGELSESHNLLAVAYRRLGRYQEALDEHQSEYELKTELLRRDPSQAYWRYRLGMVHYFMGDLQTVVGDDEGAFGSAEAATAILDSLAGYDPSNARWRRSAAQAHRQRGAILGRLGRREASLRAFGEAVAILEDLVLTDSTGFVGQQTLAMTHSLLGRVLVAFGEPEAALHEAETAEAFLAEATEERRSLLLARAQNDLVKGHALFGVGRNQEAQQSWDRALEAMLPLAGGPGGIEFQPMMAEAYIVLDRADEALRELQALRDRGYAESYLYRLAAEKGIVF